MRRVRQEAPIVRGVFEENDPAKRLQMIANYNTDISQYWNCIIYGLTH